MVENPNPLAGNPIRARVRVRSGQRVHDDRPDARQPELTGQHPSVRTSPDYDDVIHLAQLTSADLLGGQERGVPRADYADCRSAVATASPRPITAGAVSATLSDART